MASTLHVCNLALARCGARRALSPDPSEGHGMRLCLERLPQLIEAFLSDPTWKFARTRAVLAHLSASPAFGWTYQFQLPADYLAMVRWTDATETQDYAFAIEDRKILSDVDTGYLVYTHLVDISVFPADVAELLGLLLARDIATPLSAKVSLVKTLQGEIARLERIVRLRHSRESSPMDTSRYSWIEARRGRA